MATLRVPVGDADHAQGPADAPVTLVEYGDYECPHCGAAYPVVQQVQQRFGDDLRFVFRNFPLAEMHPNAVSAAGGVRSGVNGTPTFFVNGARYEGSPDVDSMGDAIDRTVRAKKKSG